MKDNNTKTTSISTYGFILQYTSREFFFSHVPFPFDYKVSPKWYIVETIHPLNAECKAGRWIKHTNSKSTDRNGGKIIALHDINTLLALLEKQKRMFPKK